MKQLKQNMNTTQTTQFLYLQCKKITRLTLHNRNNANNLFSPTTRIFLLTVSNQYNAYNLNFTTDGIRNFMSTNYQAQRIQRKIKKLRVFPFIPKRQRIQPNFMKESIRIFIHTKQPTKQTQPEQPKQRHRRGFHY